MSKKSTQDSEYYRKEWDPTFLPLIYTMVRDLSNQANNFQNSVDPTYHNFLRDCTPVSVQKNRLLENKSIIEKKNKNKSKYDRKRKWARDFAALSVLTCGNSLLSGFSNMRHRDEDFITLQSCRRMMMKLKKIYIQYNTTKNDRDLQMLLHLRNRFMKNKRFTTYTTIGYKFYHSDKSIIGTKRHHVYFIYNSLGVAISLNDKKSYYHTFDASFGSHQTSVPITETNTHVIFNDNDFFVLAWGNGKSDKRIWMEENGFNSNGRLHNKNIIDFFNQLPNQEQLHMINMGWI